MLHGTTPFTVASYICTWLALLLYAVSLTRQGRWSRSPLSPRLGPSIGLMASGVAAAGWLLMTAALLTRGLASGHWPLTTRYEFALCFAWAILAVYLLLERRWRERRAGASAMVAALLVTTYALLRPEQEQAIHPLLPALRSVWLQFHVVAAAIAYGAYGVAAALAATELAGLGDESHCIECQTRRVIGWGFPWLTLALLTGAIWAQDAWGRYWGWDPKETWTLITWLWFLLLLHSRELRGWAGRRLAWLTIAGFGIVFFTFTGLPWLLRAARMTSLHAF